MSLAGFVLAAGLGTRIGALSRFRPKPLLPIGPTNAFARAVEALRAAGADPIVANAAHLAEQIVAAGRALDVRVVVEEGGPYGTAGGLAHARRDLGQVDAVAVWNGDIVADVDVGALVRARSSAEAALAVRGREPIGRGNVGVAEDGRIVRLRDRSSSIAGAEAFGAWFAAVQVLGRSLVDAAPARGCLVGDLLIPALSRGVRVVAVPYAGPWHDVGDVSSYLAANLHHGVHVGDGAVIGPGVVLERSVIGARSSVEGAGVLREVVVWPGARARAPLSSAIVIDSGEVVPARGLDASA
ncbi:MAG: NTP transferase domain-containing protein [Deltaproteobacteria bacterium]|nr:NTP transferase domain-containing protein [Deltaproteobacteria bacterium]